MENLKELQSLLDAVEKDVVYAITNDDKVIAVTSKTKPETIKRFADKETVRKELHVKMFGGTELNAENYRLILRLFKFVYEEVNSVTKSKINKEVNIRINPKPKRS